jgi:hypothetical protein
MKRTQTNQDFFLVTALVPCSARALLRHGTCSCLERNPLVSDFASKLSINLEFTRLLRSRLISGS